MPKTEWADLLGAFTGTENYYKLFANVVLTDGAKFVADKARCYWLMDMIGLYANKYRNDEFQVYKLTVKDNNSWLLVIEDGNDNVIHTEKGQYTDFPLPSFTFWCVLGVIGDEDKEHWVIMLPSEY